MTEQEWITLTGYQPKNAGTFELSTDEHPIPSEDEDEWYIITEVYNFHPAIPDQGGKDVIRNLYSIGGMQLIRDMLSVALIFEQYENDIREAEIVLDQAVDQLKAAKELYAPIKSGTSLSKQKDQK